VETTACDDRRGALDGGVRSELDADNHVSLGNRQFHRVDRRRIAHVDDECVRAEPDHDLAGHERDVDEQRFDRAYVHGERRPVGFRHARAGRQLQQDLFVGRHVPVSLRDPSEHGGHGDGAEMLLAIPLLAAALGQDLPFDRPEAWAQQYFTTVSMLTGLGPATPERAGDVSIQLESGWIPSLSPSEERVGFSGTSAEDLNKAPVLFRPRVRVALPARFAVVVGGVPPVRAFGVTPRLVAAAVEWTMIDRRAWRASWRVHGQTGSVTGAFTCPDA